MQGGQDEVKHLEGGFPVSPLRVEHRDEGSHDDNEPQERGTDNEPQDSGSHCPENDSRDRSDDVNVSHSSTPQVDPIGTTCSTTVVRVRIRADEKILRPGTPTVACCCTSMLYETQRAGLRWADTGSDLRGRYWDRTSDLLGVNEALSR